MDEMTADKVNSQGLTDNLTPNPSPLGEGHYHADALALRQTLHDVVLVNESIARMIEQGHAVGLVKEVMITTEQTIRSQLREFEAVCNDIGHEWIDIDDEHAFCGRCGLVNYE